MRADLVLECFTDEVYNNEVVLKCPLCGNDYTHPQGAFTRMGRDKGEAKVYEGTVAKGPPTGARRSALVVVFRCESGCLFELIIQQHKGHNFIDFAAATEPDGKTGEAV